MGAEIVKNRLKNEMEFLCFLGTLLEASWNRFGSQNRPKIDAKTISKNIVEAILKGNSQKSKNHVDLHGFVTIFKKNGVPKTIKNRPKIGPESDKFPDRVSVSIFRRFGVHFGAILGAKMDQKSNKRVFETPSKNERKKSTKKRQKDLQKNCLSK